MDRFYITTPIYYVNAKPHLGHAYTTILADCLNRFHKACGESTFFLTGTDEHGDKIVQAAAKNGETPQAYVDRISSLFQELWPKLHVEPDRFIRTTESHHKAVVQQILQLVYDKGDIYHAEYEGLYCTGCERFLTEKELENGKCPQHGVPPDAIRESNYFFRMSKYQQWLADHIRNDPDFIRPGRYANEALAMLEGGVLEDLCISRPKSRLEWGVELPFDPDYVCYVWFDALINYLTALEWPDGEAFHQFWPVAQHLVAKDILKPHAIFWPTMLRAAGLEPYRRLNVHGYWLVDDTKMSKSLGNVVAPLDMVEKYGVNAFRFYLMREMHFGADSSFSEEGLVARLNADLANDLGNLVNRVLAMTHKYFGGETPPRGPLMAEDDALIELGLNAVVNCQQLFGRAECSRGLESLWELVRAMNKYVDASQPWTLNKNKEFDRLGTVMHLLLEGVRKVAAHCWPVMPEAAAAILTQLTGGFDAQTLDLRRERQGWDGMTPQVGKPVAKGSNLFPRVETPLVATTGKEAEQARSMSSPQGKADAAEEAASLIEFADFQKVDMRVGRVLAGEKHPDADKLLKLTVDVGEPTPRQIIAGLAETFAPASLVDREVVVVVNLKPRKIRGLESQGMILAVRTPEGMRLLTPGVLGDSETGGTPASVPPGARVS